MLFKLHKKSLVLLLFFFASNSITSATYQNSSENRQPKGELLELISTYEGLDILENANEQSLYFSISFTRYFSGPAEIVIRQLSTWSHLENFVGGIVTVGDFVYYLNGILICIVLTRLSIENRLWR